MGLQEVLIFSIYVVRADGKRAVGSIVAALGRFVVGAGMIQGNPGLHPAGRRQGHCRVVDHRHRLFRQCHSRTAHGLVPGSKSVRNHRVFGMTHAEPAQPGQQDQTKAQPLRKAIQNRPFFIAVNVQKINLYSWKAIAPGVSKSAGLQRFRQHRPQGRRQAYSLVRLHFQLHRGSCKRAK